MDREPRPVIFTSAAKLFSFRRIAPRRNGDPRFRAPHGNIGQMTIGVAS